jgi:molybdopterin-containing oxidoreductase family iron-sulfur binding subunit
MTNREGASKETMHSKDITDGSTPSSSSSSSESLGGCKTPKKTAKTAQDGAGAGLVRIRARTASDLAAMADTADGSPRHWRSIEELEGAAGFAGEFPGGLPAPGSGGGAEATRRDFLSLVGFSLGAAGLAACRAPVQHAIPLPTASDQIVPGLSTSYATTCGGCPAACSLLVKQRDGRPIKIEGNPDSPLFGGGACATGQATVLSLYDDARLRGPYWGGKSVSWQEVDQAIGEKLAAAREKNARVVLLSGTISSPSTRETIAAFGRKHPGFRHVVYDAVSSSALRAGAAESFGQAVTPHYAFDKARVIVGLEADFLGTWLSPVEFARQYAAVRKAIDKPSLHVQIESGMSVTGTNADVRIAVAPSELGLAAVALLARVARKAGAEAAPPAAEPAVDGRKLDQIVDQLWKHRGESLVVTGSQDVSVQVVVNTINTLLGNVGTTVDVTRPSLQRQSDDAAVVELIDDMNAGKVHTLMLLGVNPAYDHPDAQRFVSGLEKVALSVSFADRIDETGAYVHAICPDHHFLEAWGDAEPVAGHYTLAQPLIPALFDTRPAPQSLLKWLGEESDPYTTLRAFWKEKMFPRQQAVSSFDTFWDRSLQLGPVALPPAAPEAAAAAGAAPPAPRNDWKAAVVAIAADFDKAKGARQDDSYELHLYESVAMRDGRSANNPWLQELPDPVSKLTWGNAAAVAPKLARKLGLRDGDVVALKTERGEIEVPILVQPGQEGRTISVALGYGRTRAGKCGQGIGANAFALAPVVRGHRRYDASGATLRATGQRDPLATTQTHFSMEGRPIVLETTAEELRKGEHEAPEALPTLWAAKLQGAHSWGMVIDVNACTGCSACVVACQAENNVPVVGKDQVKRIRIMHWLRIDRYYSGDEETPASLHQPMMCQHCGNAPCETVCPVLATTTGSEGLNQMTYNRCIGTRYCANNCPYKVRRFNWYNYTQNSDFDYNMTSPLGRLALNPDVVVRSRGVMEKCSLCVQRIQLAKNTALKERREIADGEIQTACQQTCPTQAIVFGDLKDPQSRVSRLLHDPRAYQVLEDLGTRPNVGYLKKLRHSEET